MTRPQLTWTAALLACVLAAGGLGVFAVVNGEASSTLRVAEAHYDDAWAVAAAAADRAEHASVAADELAGHANDVVDDARTYQGVAGLDATALADLTPLIAAVEDLLAVDPPRATALPDALDSDRPEEYADGERALLDWAKSVDRAWADHPVRQLADAVGALELAAIEVASDVPALGAGVLVANATASARDPSRSASRDGCRRRGHRGRPQPTGVGAGLRRRRRASLRLRARQRMPRRPPRPKPSRTTTRHPSSRASSSHRSRCPTGS